MEGCWSLAALLCSAAVLCTAGDPTNGTDALGFDGQGDDSYERPAAEILASLLEKGVLDVDKVAARRAGSAGEDSFSDNKPWTGSKAQKPEMKPPGSAGSPGVASPSGAPNSQANGMASAESAAKHGSPRTNADNKSSDCVGCHEDVYAKRKSPSRSLLSERSDGNEEPVTGFVWPVGQGTVDLEFRKSFAKGDRPPMAESQEDSGSGDPHVKMPPSQVTHAGSSETGWNLRDFMDVATSSPSQTSTAWGNAMLSPSTEKAISPDSAEIDHLLQVPGETSVPSPSPSDGYEEGGIEDEDDDDDDLEDAEDDDVTAKDVRNFPKAATPKIHTPAAEEKPTGRQDFPFRGETHPKPRPEVNKDQTQTMSGTGENGTECRNGYVRRNSSCKSLCEIYPTYCYNGGQCYIVENIGALCRCNTQDYIWHKGLRCESIITDFQVMCVAVGTAALVVLLLFMMTVFFAKKLYLLKTENYKLRKRNRYRTPSELHNDNFSLSTIAEGSHPNEDPNAPQKVQDLPKACLKDEEPFNIQNSLSPKHECGKGDPDIVDVNCVLNNLT